MTEDKLVSVIIPTYKRPDLLPRAITSVLEQTYKNIEIIIVDDNDPSWNERRLTEEVMENFKNHNIQYLKHETNKNGSASRNTGFWHSKGDYIMFLDDDDEFTEHKVEKQVEKLEALDSSWGACYTSYIRKKNGKTIVYGAEKREGSLLTEELSRNLFVHAGSNLMIRRDVVEEVRGFDEGFKRNQDIEFLSRILVNYKLAYVDVVGLIVHIGDREYSKENFEQITRDYVNKFSKIVDTLSEYERSIIERMIELQLLRHYLTTGGNRSKFIHHLFKNKSVSIYLFFSYLVYLVKRKITRKAFGFEYRW